VLVGVGEDVTVGPKSANIPKVTTRTIPRLAQDESNDS
jgi:hypothetical protein